MNIRNKCQYVTVSDPMYYVHYVCTVDLLEIRSMILKRGKYKPYDVDTTTEGTLRWLHTLKIDQETGEVEFKVAGDIDDRTYRLKYGYYAVYESVYGVSIWTADRFVSKFKLMTLIE